ncbi:putative uncharacterized protein C1orf196 [Seriola lalandi dorsalis]|uniref:putative uncharacterized protein C1orf196 n=1 Tax=Seriola lalandi dorsalis TaxID=1841481 RepID=UPI000C6F6ED0|nr:putative uncharacterized protein C1orf196 [Seriola lalandi dorsalis]
MEEMLTCSRSPFSQVFGRQGQLMQATVQSLNSLNDQIASFMVTGPKSLEQEEHAFIPPEKETMQKSMTLMRHLLVDAQAHLVCILQSSWEEIDCRAFVTDPPSNSASPCSTRL